MNTLVLDVIEVIHNLLDTRSQVNLRMTSKYFASNLYITNLYDNVDFHRLTGEILEGYKHAVQLGLGNRYSSCNISSMHKLQKLRACGVCRINGNMLRRLTNLVVLDIRDNQVVHDINHLTNLRKLRISRGCVGDDGVKGLVGLTDLDAGWNARIRNVNHMTGLQILDARLTCGINNNGLKELVNLRELNLDDNRNVSDVNHLTKLRWLNVGWYSGVGDEGLRDLTGLTYLDIHENDKVTKISHMTKLEKLIAPDGSQIMDYFNRNQKLNRK